MSAKNFLDPRVADLRQHRRDARKFMPKECQSALQDPAQRTSLTFFSSQVGVTEMMRAHDISEASFVARRKPSKGIMR